MKQVVTVMQKLPMSFMSKLIYCRHFNTLTKLATICTPFLQSPLQLNSMDLKMSYDVLI